jgi:ATP-dependent DNA ligase
MRRERLGYTAVALVGTTSRPPRWIKPQLTRLVDEAPTGKDWLHEIKYDGYRMHARFDQEQFEVAVLNRRKPTEAVNQAEGASSARVGSGIARSYRLRSADRTSH